MFPAKDKLTICFAHVAYAMQDQFAKRSTGIKSFQVRSYEEFEKRVGEADVVVASGMWKNDIIPKAKGEAAQVVNQAKGYAQARVARAEGEAALPLARWRVSRRHRRRGKPRAH